MNKKELGVKMCPQKIMIIQPMNGLSDIEIKETRNRAIKDCTDHGYIVINSYIDGFESDWAENQKHIGLAYLSLSLKAMSQCDAVYLCKGWDKARGCIIEYKAAKAYSLDIIDSF